MNDGRSGERGSGISVLAARHDDDDDDDINYSIVAGVLQGEMLAHTSLSYV